MDSWDNKNLYLILDTSYVAPDRIISVAEECCEAGVDIVQFRDKMLSDKDRFLLCTELYAVCSGYGIPFIVNDRLDLALAASADGVHLGQDDLPVAIARSILKKCGKQLIIGTSTHSLKQAQHAIHAEPDYIAIGPLFPTNTKPDYTPVGLDTARSVAQNTPIPVFGIGGVNPERLPGIKETGISRVAVVSAILSAPDRTEIIQQFKKMLLQNKEE